MEERNDKIIKRTREEENGEIQKGDFSKTKLKWKMNEWKMKMCNMYCNVYSKGMQNE